MPIYSLGDRRPVFPAEYYVAPTASLIGSVTLGHQASVWFNVVIRSDREIINIGERSNIQDGSVLHSDPDRPLILGNDVSVGHKAMLHGCSIGNGSLIGMNSIILNGAKIGAGSIIGAGALVAEDKEIPPGVLVLGAPGKVVRDLKPEEQEWLMRIADGYVQRASRYRKELQPMEVFAGP